MRAIMSVNVDMLQILEQINTAVSLHIFFLKVSSNLLVKGQTNEWVTIQWFLFGMNLY